MNMTSLEDEVLAATARRIVGERTGAVDGLTYVREYNEYIAVMAAFVLAVFLMITIFYGQLWAVVGVVIASYALYKACLTGSVARELAVKVGAMEAIDKPV